MTVPPSPDVTDYDPQLWGPAGWKFLHFITFSYPIQPKQRHITEYGHFFKSLGNVLPCKSCRNHYRSHLEKAETDSYGNYTFLKDRRSLSSWLVDVHNSVNGHRNKKKLDYEAIKYQYETSKNMCNKPEMTGAYVNLMQDRRKIPQGRTYENVPWVAILLVALVILGVCSGSIWYSCTQCRSG